MKLSKEISTILKVIYSNCKRIFIASGTHNINHAHFHLIPIVDDESSSPIIPEYEE